MSIVVFVFAGQLFATGWPDKYFCGRWVYDPTPGRYGPGHWEDGSASCNQRMIVVRILMGIGGGLSIIVGFVFPFPLLLHPGKLTMNFSLLLLTTTLLQTVALARTKFWRGTNFKRYGTLNGLRNWKPQGFTIQFTLTVMPPIKQDESGAFVGAENAEAAKPVAGQASSSAESGRLIET